MRILSVILLFILGDLSGQTTLDQPNIVLIIADDIGWNDLGCYGNEAVHTPNLDRMASEGLKFTNAYLTTSSCSPSRTSIISGRYPHNTGSAELHTPLPESIEIFPEKLKEGGYYTGQAGKWHMGDAPRRGFDVIYDDGKSNGPGGEAQWIPLLKQRPKNKPFFLWLASIDAHRPWDLDNYENDYSLEDVPVPPFLVDTHSTRRDLARYYDEIQRFDDYVGQVERELERQEVAHNTIILVITDNGRPFPRCKTRLYDSGVKTFMLAKWPGGISQPGAESTSLISAIDIAPTILDLAGVQSPESIQGSSFRSLLENPEQRFRTFLFAEHNWHDHEALERMVRTEDFMYIMNYRPLLANQGPADSNNSPSFKDLLERKKAGKLNRAQADVFMTPRPDEELYNVRSDSLQLFNLASDSSYTKQLNIMRNILQEWTQETGDSHPAHLTTDWYSRDSGDALDLKRKRGEMPGTSNNAVSINAPGPF